MKKTTMYNCMLFTCKTVQFTFDFFYSHVKYHFTCKNSRSHVKMRNSHMKKQIKWLHFMCHVLFPHVNILGHMWKSQLYMNVCKSFIQLSKKPITCENVQLTHDIIPFSHVKILVRVISFKCGIHMWKKKLRVITCCFQI